METLGHCQADIFIAPFFAAVDCQWSGWGDWSPCSVSCGQGEKTRGRSKSPAKYGGAECDGESLDTEVCNQGACRKFYKQLVFIGTLWRHWDIATLTCLLRHFLQLLIANGMDGWLGVPAQLLVAKGNGRETDLNHPQNTVELNAMAIL